MSGIYIPGMKMPKRLKKTITIYPNGMVRVWVNNKGSGELLEQRAVPVPDHGRLIDADEFLKRAISTKCFRGDCALMLEELVGESTTIIPASREGE